MPEQHVTQQLIHQVNNLLGVIQTQAEVARAVDSTDAMRRALAMIEDAAGRTARRIQELRRELETGGQLS